MISFFWTDLEVLKVIAVPALHLCDGICNFSRPIFSNAVMHSSTPLLPVLVGVVLLCIVIFSPNGKFRRRCCGSKLCPT